MSLFSLSLFSFFLSAFPSFHSLGSFVVLWSLSSQPTCTLLPRWSWQYTLKWNYEQKDMFVEKIKLHTDFCKGSLDKLGLCTAASSMWSPATGLKYHSCCLVGKHLHFPLKLNTTGLLWHFIHSSSLAETYPSMQGNTRDRSLVHPKAHTDRHTINQEEEPMIHLTCMALDCGRNWGTRRKPKAKPNMGRKRKIHTERAKGRASNLDPPAVRQQLRPAGVVSVNGHKTWCVWLWFDFRHALYSFSRPHCYPFIHLSVIYPSNYLSIHTLFGQGIEPRIFLPWGDKVTITNLPAAALFLSFCHLHFLFSLGYGFLFDLYVTPLVQSVSERTMYMLNTHKLAFLAVV